MKFLTCLALGAVLLAEALLFQRLIAPRHAWFYPQWYDQVQYLTEAYRGAEALHADGPAAGFRTVFGQVSAQGALHGPAALLAFVLGGGPSREAALAVNLAAFLLLQAVTFLAIRKVTGSLPLAWIGLAMLVALHCPWSGQSASMVDFRLDWLSACTYGIALAAALATGGFRSTRWSLAFGGAVALAVLGRFVTAVYFGLAYTLLLAWLLTQPDRLRRGGRLLLSGLFAAALFGPVLWRCRQAIHDYYWLGHVSGAERALRDANAGFLTAIPWLLARVAEHAGLPALLLGLAAAGFLWWQRRRGRVAEETSPAQSTRDAWTIVLVFLAAPLGTLAAHTLRAPQPVVVLLPTVAWLVALACWQAGRQLPPVRLAATAVAVLVGATAITTVTIARAAPAASTVRDGARLNALLDYFCYRAQAAHLAAPRLAVTRHIEGLDAIVLRLSAYERHGRFVPFAQSLPTGLFAAPPDVVSQALPGNDFVVLSRSETAAPWPFDRQMVESLPVMLAWCTGHLRHVADLEIAGQTLSVFERPDLPPPGSGADLPSLVATSERVPDSYRPNPPAPPRFEPPPRILASTRTPFRLTLAAAYSPVRYHATGLPEGLRLGGRSGVLQGRFARAGTFPVQVTATNPAGATTREILFQVIADESFTGVEVPPTATAGAAVEIRFEAFDATGKLNYIDVSDLPAGKNLGRIEAGPDEKQFWSGRHAVTFATPGTHTLVLRFVRFDAGKNPAYTFVDQVRQITVMAP